MWMPMGRMSDMIPSLFQQDLRKKNGRSSMLHGVALMVYATEDLGMVVYRLRCFTSFNYDTPELTTFSLTC